MLWTNICKRANPRAPVTSKKNTHFALIREQVVQSFDQERFFFLRSVFACDGGAGAVRYFANISVYLNVYSRVYAHVRVHVRIHAHVHVYALHDARLRVHVRIHVYRRVYKQRPVSSS